MRRLGDPHAPEQPERAQPLLALDERVEAERAARLQRHLAPHQVGSRAIGAGDQHVIDAGLRPLAHDVGDRDGPRRLSGRLADVDDGPLITEIAIAPFDRRAIERLLGPVVRLAGGEGQPASSSAGVSALTPSKTTDDTTVRAPSTTSRRTVTGTVPATAAAVVTRGVTRTAAKPRTR